MFDSDGNLKSPFKECSTGGFSVIAFTDSFDITKKEIYLRIEFEQKFQGSQVESDVVF